MREARERMGLSQRKLGVLAGLDPSVASKRVNRYEQGIHLPDYSTLTALARVLGRPVAYFYADSEALAVWIEGFVEPGSDDGH
nr:helix-turn-helix transcriptional regulator [Thiorhodococcus minor]